MTDSEINKIILEKIPEISDKYWEERNGFWDGDEIGPNIVIEDFITKEIIKKLQGSKDLGYVQRMFEGIEELIKIDDADLRNHLCIGVFEYICCTPGIPLKAKKYMGPKSIQCYVEQYGDFK